MATVPNVEVVMATDRSLCAGTEDGGFPWAPNSLDMERFVDSTRGKVLLTSARSFRHLPVGRDGRCLLLRHGRALIVVGGDGEDRYDDGVWYAPRRSLLRPVSGLALVTPFTLSGYAHGGHNNPLGIGPLLCIGGPSFCEALETIHPACVRKAHVSLHEGPKGGTYQKAKQEDRLLHCGKPTLQWKAPFAGSREWLVESPPHYEERGSNRLVRVTLRRRDEGSQVDGGPVGRVGFDELLHQLHGHYYWR